MRILRRYTALREGVDRLLASSRHGCGRRIYFGLHAVLFFATRPLAFADVKLLGWESLSGTTGDVKEAERAPH